MADFDTITYRATAETRDAERQFDRLDRTITKTARPRTASLDVDTAKARKAVFHLDGELKKFKIAAQKKTNVDLDTKSATAKVSKLRAGVAALKAAASKSTSIKIDTTAATAKVAILKRQIKSIDHRTTIPTPRAPRPTIGGGGDGGGPAIPLLGGSADGADRVTRSFFRLNTIGKTLGGTFGILRSAIGLLKFPLLFQGAVFAAQGLTTLAGAAVGLIGTLRRLGGVLAALPGMLFGLGAVFGVLKTAFGGVGGALGELIAAETAAGGAASGMTDQVNTAKSSMEEYMKSLKETTFAQDAFTGKNFELPEFKPPDINKMPAMPEGYGAGGDGALAEFNKLSPAAQKFVKLLMELRKEWLKIKYAVQEGFFPGAEAGLRQLAYALLPTVAVGFYRLSVVLGDVARNIGRGLGTKEFADDIGLLFRSTEEMAKDLGNAIAPLVRAFVNIAVAARPFTEWMVQGLATMILKFEAWTAKVRGDGSLARYLESTKQAMQDWWSVIRDVGAGIANIFGAASDSSEWFMKGMVDGAANFRAWTEDDSNMQGVRDFFENIKEPLLTFKGLMGDIARGWGRLFASEEGQANVTMILDAIRGFGPTMGRLIEQFGNGDFLARMIDMLTPLGEMLLTLFGPSGVGMAVVKGIAELGNAFLWINENVPFATEAIKIFAGVMAGMAIANHFGKIASQFGGFLKVMGGGSALKLLTNPWVLLIAAIVVAAVVIYKNWDKISAFLKRTWEWIKKTAGVIWGAIYDQLMKFEIFRAFARNWDQIRDTIVMVAKAIWEGIKLYWGLIVAYWKVVWEIIKVYWAVFKVWLDLAIEWVKILWQGVQLYFNLLWEVVKLYLTGYVFPLMRAIWGVVQEVIGFFTALWEHVRNIWDWIWGKVSDIWNNWLSPLFTGIGIVIDEVKTFFQGLWDKVVEVWDGIWEHIDTAVGWIGEAIDTLKGFFTGIWDGLTSGLMGILNWIIGAFEGMINNVIGVMNKGLDVIDKAAGPTVNFDEIPKVSIPRLSRNTPSSQRPRPVTGAFEMGGIIRQPTLALMGERYKPEAVIPLTNPGRAAELMKQTGLDKLAGGKDINITQHFYEKVDSHAIASDIAWRLAG